MAPPPLFLYGTLRHLPLLEVVAGTMPVIRPGRLRGYRPKTVVGESFPALRSAPGHVLDGVLADGLDAEARQRIDFYEGDEFAHRPVSVETDDGPVDAIVYVPTEILREGDEAWAFEQWSPEDAEAAVIAGRDLMALRGRVPDAQAWDGYTQMLVRAHSAIRARATPAPATVRRAIPAGDVDVVRRDTPYSNFFAVGEADVTHPIAGGRSDILSRAAFMMGDAVTVLPYDPQRDTVLVIDQFRFGAFMRGEPLPWILEPIAGRIDPGEAPEDTARREAREEADLDISALHLVGKYYPSPAGVTEWLVSYIGIADLPEAAAGVGGLETEGEDIVSHVIPFDRLMDLVETGEAANGPLLLSALWLARHRHTLA